MNEGSFRSYGDILDESAQDKTREPEYKQEFDRSKVESPVGQFLPDVVRSQIGDAASSMPVSPIAAFKNDEFTDEERKRRQAKLIAARNVLFSSNIEKMTPEFASGFYQAVHRGLFGLEDPDGKVAFGSRASDDPKKNLEMLRRFCKGEHQLIEDDEQQKWRQMSWEEKFKYAREHESARNSFASIAKGERGASLGELAYLSAVAGSEGMMLPPPGGDPNKEATREISRRINYDTMTPEEKKAYETDIIADYEERLMKNNRLAAYLGLTEGLSDRAKWLVAKGVNDGECDMDALRQLRGMEPERALTAIKMARGNLTHGRILGIDTDFSTGTTGDRVQMGLYGFQQALVGLVTDTADFARDVGVYALAKSMSDDREFREISDAMSFRAKVDQAFTQGLPDPDGFLGEAWQGVMENLHWFIPWGVATKGRATMVVATGISRPTIGVTARALALKPSAWKTLVADYAKTFLPLSNAKVADMGKAVASAKDAYELAQLRSLGMMIGAKTKGLENVLGPISAELIARQGAAVEKLRKGYQTARRMAAWKDAGGAAMASAGTMVNFSTFAREYMDNAVAAGADWDDALVTAVGVGLVNAKIENIWIPGVEGGLSRGELGMLTWASLRQAIANTVGKSGKAGLKEFLGNYARKYAASAGRAAFEEGIVEEPLQQLVIEHGIAFDKALKEYGYTGPSQILQALIPTADDWKTFIDTAIEMLPNDFGFAITSLPMSVGRHSASQRWHNFWARNWTYRRDEAKRQQDWLVEHGSLEGYTPGKMPTMFTATGQLSPEMARGEYSKVTDLDYGVVDMIQREINLQRVVKDEWSEGGERAEAGNPKKERGTRLKVAERIQVARDLWKANDGTGDVVGAVADALGVGRQTAEVACSVFEAEGDFTEFNGKARTVLNANFVLASLTESDLKEINPNIVDGSFMRDEKTGSVKADILIDMGKDENGKDREPVRKTIVYRVGSSVLSDEDVPAAAANGSTFGMSWIETHRGETVHGRKVETWDELTDDERLEIVKRDRFFAKGSAGSGATVVFTDKDGNEKKIDADFLVSFATGRVGDIGYGPAATRSTMFHENFHILWDSVKEFIPEDARKDLARRFGIDVENEDDWDGALQEKMAVQLEAYSGGRIVPKFSQDAIEGMQRGIRGALGGLLDMMAPKTIDPETGKEYGLKDFYDAVLRGDLGNAAELLKAGTSKMPGPEGATKPSEGKLPGNVTAEELAAKDVETAKQGTEDEERDADGQPQEPQQPQPAQPVVRRPSWDHGDRIDRKCPGKRWKLKCKLVLMSVHDLVTQQAQGRDVTAKDYKDRVDEMARTWEIEEGTKIDNTVLLGVPTAFTKDVVPGAVDKSVFAGNTRTSAILKIYENGGDVTDAFRASQEQLAEERGLEKAEGWENDPVVIALLEEVEVPGSEKVPTAQEIADASNGNIASAYGASESAGAHATILIANNLIPLFQIDLQTGEIVDNDDAYKTSRVNPIGEFYRKAGGNKALPDFYRKDTTNLSDDGQRILRNAILSALFGGRGGETVARLMSEADRLGMQNEMAALVQLAPELLSLANDREHVKYDLRSPLVEALGWVQRWLDADEAARKSAGKTHAEWKRRKDGKPIEPAALATTWENFREGDMTEKPSDEAKILGDLLAAAHQALSWSQDGEGGDERPSEASKLAARRLITGYVRDYLENVSHATVAVEDGLFGGTEDAAAFEPPTTAEILRTQRGTRFSVGETLYHGSAADWRIPSLAYLGTGQGAAVEGYGINFTTDRDMADAWGRIARRAKEERGGYGRGLVGLARYLFSPVFRYEAKLSDGANIVDYYGEVGEDVRRRVAGVLEKRGVRLTERDAKRLDDAAKVSFAKFQNALFSLRSGSGVKISPVAAAAVLVDAGIDGSKMDSGVDGEEKTYSIFNLKKIENVHQYRNGVKRWSIAANGAYAVTSDDVNLALSTFGKAKGIGDAIYCLPDGTMLKGEGRVYVFGGRRIESFGHDGWLAQIHGKLANPDDDNATYAGKFEAAQRAIARAGAIRISGDKNGFTVSREPTEAQYDALYDMAEKAYLIMEENGDDEMMIDVTDENLHTLFTLAYPRGTSARRIIEDLRGWYERGENPAERERSMLAEFHRWSVAPRGVQKGAAVEYPDAADELREMGDAAESPRWSIGVRRRAEFRELIGRKRSDIAPEDIEAYLDEIAGYESAKKQKLAVHWIITGAIELPQDAYKLDKAIVTAERAKVDPFQYRNPEDIFAAFPQHLPKEKPIDPDTVPELTGKTDMGHGVTVYDVRDDREGQRAMRRIVNTHFGKDASPWCLLQGEGDTGELSDQAWHYWQHYNSLPKKVAFLNGKLLAFMATDKERTVDTDGTFDAFGNDRYVVVDEKIPEQWWDRKDASHDGIPIEGLIPGDALGRSGMRELKDGKFRVVGRLWRGSRQNGKYEEWYNDQKTLEQEFKDGKPVGWRRTYGEWGNITSVEHFDKNSNHDRPQLEFTQDGGLRRFVEYAEGDKPIRIAAFYSDGELMSYNESKDDVQPDRAYWRDNGQNISWKDDAGNYYSVRMLSDGRFWSVVVSKAGSFSTDVIAQNDDEYAALPSEFRAKLEGESAAVLEAMKAEAAAIYREYSPAAGKRWSMSARGSSLDYVDYLSMLSRKAQAYGDDLVNWMPKLKGWGLTPITRHDLFGAAYAAGQIYQGGGSVPRSERAIDKRTGEMGDWVRGFMRRAKNDAMLAEMESDEFDLKDGVITPRKGAPVGRIGRMIRRDISPVPYAVAVRLPGFGEYFGMTVRYGQEAQGLAACFKQTEGFYNQIQKLKEKIEEKRRLGKDKGIAGRPMRLDQMGVNVANEGRVIGATPVEDWVGGEANYSRMRGEILRGVTTARLWEIVDGLKNLPRLAVDDRERKYLERAGRLILAVSGNVKERPIREIAVNAAEEIAKGIVTDDMISRIIKDFERSKAQNVHLVYIHRNARRSLLANRVADEIARRLTEEGVFVNTEIDYVLPSVLPGGTDSRPWGYVIAVDDWFSPEIFDIPVSVLNAGRSFGNLGALTYVSAFGTKVGNRFAIPESELTQLLKDAKISLTKFKEVHGYDIRLLTGPEAREKLRNIHNEWEDSRVLVGSGLVRRTGQPRFGGRLDQSEDRVLGRLSEVRGVSRDAVHGSEEVSRSSPRGNSKFSQALESHLDDDTRWSIASRKLDWDALPDTLDKVVFSTSVQHFTGQDKVPVQYEIFKQYRDYGHLDIIRPEVEKWAKSTGPLGWLGLYLKGKYYGDIEAARKVVRHRISNQRIGAVRSVLEPNVPVKWLYVRNDDGKRTNRLPQAYAEALAARFGGAVDDSIVKVSDQRNTSAGMRTRAHREFQFAGEPEKGVQYVIADDVWTTGQTTVSLLDYLVGKGANVRGITTLAVASHGDEIKPPKARLESVLKKAQFKSVEEANAAVGLDLRKATGSELLAYFTGARANKYGFIDWFDPSANEFGLDFAGRGRAESGLMPPLFSEPERERLDLQRWRERNASQGVFAFSIGEALSEPLVRAMERRPWRGSRLHGVDRDIMHGVDRDTRWSVGGTIGEAFPQLREMSDDELVIAAEAVRLALNTKGGKRFMNITRMQRDLKGLEPSQSHENLGVRAVSVIQAARNLAKKMRADLDRGVSESRILVHLPETMKEVFGSEMTARLRKGAKIGVYAERARKEIERRQEKVITDAVAIQSGVETKIMENAYGLDFSRTLMNLAENPYIRTDENGNRLPSERSEGEDGGAVDEESSGAAVKPVEAKVAEAVSEVARRAHELSEADKAKKEELRRQAGRDAENQLAFNQEENAAAGEAGEGSGAMFTGDEDLVDVATRKAGVNLQDPRELALFVSELSRKYWNDTHSLGNKTDTWNDPVAMQFLRKTAANIYSKLVNDLVYSQARDTATRAIGRFENVPTARGLLSEMTFVGQLIHAKRMADTQKAMCEQLSQFLEDNFGTSGRFKPDKEELRRKVSAEMELRARYTRHVIWLTPDALDAEIEAMQRNLHGVEVEFGDAGRDIDQSKVMVETVRKFQILREFGGLVYKPLAQIQAAIEYWENALRGDTDRIVRDNYERDLLTEKAAEKLAAAFDNPKLKTAVEKNLKSLFNDYIESHMGFFVLLRDLMRFAPDDVRANAEQIIEYLELAVQKAGTRSMSGKRRHGDALANAVRSIYRRDFRKVLAELNQRDDRFIEFMGEVSPGKKEIPTKGKAMQLFVSLLQVGHPVEVMDKDGESHIEWVGGYHDNIVKNHREGQAEKIRRLLTVEDLNLISWLGKWYEANRENLSTVAKALFGIGVYAETANYMPVKMLLDPQGLEKGNAVGWTIFPRLLTPRVRNERDFDTSADILTMFMSRMEESEQWASHAKLGLELRGIFGRSVLRKSIRANHGESADQLVQGFITDILSGRGAGDLTTGKFSFYADRIRGMAALGALGGNLGVTLKQTTSIPAFGFELGLAKTSKYILSAWSPDGFTAMREIFDSAERKNRWDVGNSEAVKNALSMNASGTLMKMLRASMITNKVGDVVPALVVGQGIYRDALAQGMSREDAMARTWMLIERTQQSSRLENQPEFVRRSRAARALFQFLTTQVQYLGYEAKAIREVMAKPGDIRRWGSLGNVLLLNHFLLSSLYFGMGQLWKRLLGQEPPPDDELADWMVTCLLGPFGALYVAGFTATEALNVWVKGKKFGTQSTLPSLSWASNIFVRDPGSLLGAIFSHDKGTLDDVLSAAGKWLSDFNATFRDARKVYRYRIKGERQRK